MVNPAQFSSWETPTITWGEGPPVMEMGMADKTAAELHADWIVAQNIARFHERFNAETDDGRFEILAALLADEFTKFEKAPLH
jgi:hypothetical protein